MENTKTSKGFSRSFMDGFILKNPVLVLSLGLTLAILLTNSFENSLILAVVVGADLLITQIIISIFRKLLNKTGAITLATLISAGIASLLYLVVDKGVPFFSENFVDAYSKITLAVVPFIATTSAVVVKAQETIDRPFDDTLGDTLGSILGFALGLCLIALIRESLATGGLVFHFNYEEPLVVKFWQSGFKLPMFDGVFGGFLVTGVVSGLYGTVAHAISHALDRKKEVK
jgi:membrane protein